MFNLFVERFMLRAMSELEKAVDGLLERLKSPPSSPPRPAGFPARGGEGDLREREREASEWIRRALDRLRAL